MKIRINRLFNVVDAQGEKVDEGTLQRYLGEIVWYPSGALSPYITWKEISPGIVEATMEYNGTKGSGKFFFRESGEFYKFSAMRYQGNDPDSVRREWVIESFETKEFHGVKIPSKMQATWKLPEGDWKWLELEVVSMDYNR